MKEGQDADHHIVRGKVNDLFDCLDIGTDIGLCEHDPLGATRRPRGENHRQHVIAADGMQIE